MVKFKEALNSFGAIVGIDLATYKSGVTVYNVKTGNFDLFFPVTVKNTEEHKGYSLFVQLKKLFEEISSKYGRIMVIQERLPQQGGKFSTIATLQSLAASHAIMELAVVMTENVDLYDEHGIHTTSVKALFKSQDCPKPQKKDIRKALVKLYRLDDTLLTDDISDAIAVVHTLLQKKWNQDIDDQIKVVKKQIKELKMVHAIKEHEEEIERLTKLKI